MRNAREDLEAISALGIRCVAVENSLGEFFIYYQATCERYELLEVAPGQGALRFSRREVARLFSDSANMTILTGPPGFSSSRPSTRAMPKAVSKSVLKVRSASLGVEPPGEFETNGVPPHGQGGGDPPEPRGVKGVLDALDAMHGLIQPANDDESDKESSSETSTNADSTADK